MDSTSSKQKCLPNCQLHTFQLQKLKNNSKSDVKVCFCPKPRREPYPPQGIMPEWNSDKKYYTQAFVLGTEKKNLSVWAHSSYMSFQEQIKQSLQKNNAQFSFPQPKKNRYCSVCKVHFGSYYFHIGDENHLDKIKAALYNKEILKLCEGYRELWDGAEEKADARFHSALDEQEMEFEEEARKKKLFQLPEYDKEELNSRSFLEKDKSACQLSMSKKLSLSSVPLARKNTTMKQLMKDYKEIKKRFGKRKTVRIYLRRETAESKYEIVQRKRREKEISKSVSIIDVEEIYQRNQKEREIEINEQKQRKYEKEVIILDSEKEAEKSEVIDLTEKFEKKDETTMLANMETSLCDKLINRIREKRKQKLRQFQQKKNKSREAIENKKNEQKNAEKNEQKNAGKKEQPGQKIEKQIKQTKKNKQRHQKEEVKKVKKAKEMKEVKETKEVKQTKKEKKQTKEGQGIEKTNESKLPSASKQRRQNDQSKSTEKKQTKQTQIFPQPEMKPFQKMNPYPKHQPYPYPPPPPPPPYWHNYPPSHLQPPEERKPIEQHPFMKERRIPPPPPPYYGPNPHLPPPYPPPPMYYRNPPPPPFYGNPYQRNMQNNFKGEKEKSTQKRYYEDMQNPPPMYHQMPPPPPPFMNPNEMNRNDHPQMMHPPPYDYQPQTIQKKTSFKVEQKK